MKKQETLAHNKSQLAKLMANENITVRHRPIKTAKFDMKNRVLHCPIWQDMDGNIYDLLMGHEISHALNTPLLGWHDTITSDIKDKSRPKIKGFLNIIEDARIEKLVKRKYPGLRRPFADAYKTLFERDLFKVAKLKGDYSKLRLIDRINLYFKVGAHLNIQFDKEEQKYVDRAEDLETFEDAAQLARDIYDYAKNKEPEKEKKKEEDKKNPPKKKQKPKKKPKEQKPKEGDDKGDEKGGEQDDENEPKPKPGEDEGDGDSGDDTDIHDEDEPDEDSSGGSDSDDDTDDDTEDGDEDDSGSDPDDSDPDSSDENGDSDDSGDGDDEVETNEGGGKDAGRNKDNTPLEEPEAQTDDAFREQEKELVNEKGEGILYLDLPKPDLSKIIIPHKMVVGKYELAINALMTATGDPRRSINKAMNYSEVSNGLNAAFHKRNKGFIAMLVKEFEMRKNANQYSRQLTSKTGELDDKRIARYKLTNDIFRKVTTITKGKSHGMIMFLDFSGSMSGTMREILEQVLVLVSFCKRVGIPFDVYGFGDTHSYNFGAGSVFMWTPINGGFNFGDDSFCLRHLISSGLAGNAYKRAFTMLNVVGQISNANERDPESSKCFNREDYTGNFSQLGFELGGTPFNETLVASKAIIDKFKAQHNVDITNVIYLSDGDGYGSIANGTAYNSLDYNERGKTRIGVRDFATKLGVLTDNTTAVPFQTALTRLVAMTTGCRHIGYYFGTSHEIARKVAQNSDLQKNLAEHLKFLTDNGFLAVSNLGYDKYYYVNKDTTTYRGELKFYPNTDTSVMGKAFIKHQTKKMNSKLIIKEFATDIAE